MQPISLHELYQSGCATIPKESGVYFVMVPDDMKISFLPSALNPHAPSYEVAVLQKKYAICAEKKILYIGKASGKNGLCQRLRQYMKYGWNEGTNHKGGRAIWQILHAEQLLLTYEICKDADKREHELLSEFKAKNGCYPLANWKG